MYIFSVCVARNNSPVVPGCSSPDHRPLDLIPLVYPMYCLDRLSVGQLYFMLGKSKLYRLLRIVKKIISFIRIDPLMITAAHSFAGQNDMVSWYKTKRQLFQFRHLIIYLLKLRQSISICPVREQCNSYRQGVYYSWVKRSDRFIFTFIISFVLIIPLLLFTTVPPPLKLLIWSCYSAWKVIFAYSLGFTVAAI